MARLSLTSLKVPVMIDRMALDEAEYTATLFARVLMQLPYYNEVAKTAELHKYLPNSLKSARLRDPDSVLVARIGPKIVGFCFNNQDDGLIWLSWFGVDPDYRLKGIGSALLRELEKTVRGGRSHKIWCDCRTENEPSIQALAKQGYVQLCTCLNHWYGQDFMLWEKLVS